MFKLSVFGGVAPRFNERTLPAPYAQTAHNCKMDRGQLRAFAGSAPVAATTTIQANTQTLFRYKPQDTEHYLQWPSKVSAVENALPNDQYRRVYWTGDLDGPRMADSATILGATSTYPSNSFMLGIPYPDVVPVIARTPTADSPTQEEIDNGTANPISRSYTYTYVSDFGEESAPFANADGTPLDVITVYEGDHVTVSNLGTGPSGNYAMSNGKKRVYQLDLNGQWRLAATIPLAQDSVVIDHMAVNGAVMLSDIRIGDVPPDTMQGLVMSNFGFLVGFDGSDLCCSSTYLCHNWPLAYRYPIRTKILGLVPATQGVIVVTEGGLYVAMGSDPANITVVSVDETAGCVSADSIVDMGGYVLYCSQNGVMMGTQSEARLVTEPVFLPNDWPEYKPESMVAVRHLNRYIFYNDFYGFVLNPHGESDLLTTFDLKFQAPHTSIKDHHLMYHNGDGKLYKFDADKGNPYPYVWQSTQMIQQGGINGTCLKLDADNFDDISLSVYMDDVQVFSGVRWDVQPGRPIAYGRLPPYREALDVKVVLQGTSPINSLVIADSFAEMRGE